MGSHSGEKSPFERRREDRLADQLAGQVRVLCKGLIYLHQTEKAILVQEGEGLAGIEWRTYGKKTWFPKSAVNCSPYILTLKPGDEVEMDMTKRLAEEKEMLYE